jgi:hypothetical protein
LNEWTDLRVDELRIHILVAHDIFGASYVQMSKLAKVPILQITNIANQIHHCPNPYYMDRIEPMVKKINDQKNRRHIELIQELDGLYKKGLDK